MKRLLLCLFVFMGFTLCLSKIPLDCFKAGDYYGAGLPGGRRLGVASPEKCQKICQQTTGCNYFTWHSAKRCYLKSKPGTRGLIRITITSGPRQCDGDALLITGGLRGDQDASIYIPD